MSKQLFEFVKVAAGEPFPFESGRYSGYNSVFGPNETEANDWHKGEVSKLVHWYILRPAESPDAGREGFRQDIAEDAWDRFSQFVDDDLDSCQQIAGGDVMPNKHHFFNAIQQYLERSVLTAGKGAKGPFDEERITDFQKGFKKGTGYGKAQCPPTPDINVGDISAGDRKSDTYWYETGFKDGKAAAPVPDREEFIEKMCRSFIPPLYKADVPKLADFMRSHWPIPADPGSQVEAVELLKWIEANRWECFYDGKWRSRIDGVLHEKTHKELANLYNLNP